MGRWTRKPEYEPAPGVGRKPISLPPDFVRLRPQNGEDADCAVAVIGTVFGLTRDEALLRCGSVAPRVLEEGMSDEEIDRALKPLGIPYVRLRPGEYDLNEDTGILEVKGRSGQHFTFLWAGRIVDGNGEHWLYPEDYLARYRYRAGSLLMRTK